MDHAVHTFWARLFRRATDMQEKRGEALEYLDKVLQSPEKHGLPSDGVLDIHLQSGGAYHMLVLPTGGEECLFIPSSKQTLQSLASRCAPWLLQHMFRRGCTPEPSTLAELLQPTRVRQRFFDVAREAKEAAVAFIEAARPLLKNREFAAKCVEAVLLSYQLPSTITRLLKLIEETTPGTLLQKRGLALFVARLRKLPCDVRRKICFMASINKDVLTNIPNSKKKVVSLIATYVSNGNHATSQYVCSLTHALHRAFPRQMQVDAFADKMVSRLADMETGNQEELEQLSAWFKQCAQNPDACPISEDGLQTFEDMYSQQDTPLIALGSRWSGLEPAVIATPQVHVSIEQLFAKHPVLTFSRQ
jgi:hypothetical protein